MVGKTPVFFAYESRHQLLLPIGFSFLVVSLIGIVVTERFRALVLITALIVFTTVSIQLQYCYLIGWLKQESVMANLRSNPLPQQYKTIEVIDYTAFYNATDRPIAFYEWCGIVKYVTGKEDRLFITTDFWSDVPPGGTLQDFVDIRTKANAMVQRNMKDYIPDRSCQAMVINPTQYRLDSRNVAALLFTYYFERETFIRQVGRYTSISLKESCSDAVHTILP